ncbi:MAG: glycosyltransferase [Polyangia bacterium]
MDILIPSVIGAALTVAFVAWQRTLARARRRPEPPRKTLWHYPSVSVIRPVRGADVGARENFEAALDTGYPGEVETLFVFDDATDPAYPYACRAAGRHPGARVLVAGPPPAGRTGKLNAMIVGLAAAKGELVAFGDSDTRPSRELLRLLVEALLDDSRAGVSFAPAVVQRPPRTAGDAGYALLINSWYGASAAMIREDGALPFIMGQLMLWRRSALDAIGGLAVADGQLVDDMYLGQKVVEAGLRNVMIDQPLQLTIGGMGFVEYARLMRRWLAFGRTGLPFRFNLFNGLRAAASMVALGAVALALGSGQFTAALVPALAVVAWVASTLRLHRLFGGKPIPLRHAWMAFAVPVGGPIIMASILLHRRVAWRGRAYDLDASARLRESS